MSLTHVRLAAVCCVAVLSSCSIDLTLPAAPQQGSVVGLLDTTPIDGAGHTVMLVDTNGQKRSVQSEADGAFRFPEVAPGLYAVDLRIDGFAPLVVPNVRVKSGEAVDVGVLKPVFLQGQQASGFIRGRVTNDSGGAVVGTSLQFFLPSSSSPLTAAVADADGNFDAPVAPGTWRIVARHPWYEEKTLEGTVVAEGQTVDLRMSPIVLQIRPATISGVVLIERDGQAAVPADGATVSLSTGSNTTTTNAQGEYTLTGVVAGTHQLRASLGSYTDPEPSRTITVEPDGTSMADTITLSLLRASVRGTVETADGAPADGVTASLAPVGYGAAAAVGAVSSRAQYLITGVPYGDYTLTLSKTGYFRASFPVRVDAPSINVSNTVLAPQSGDFIIDDLDAENTPTFARTPDVTVVFTNTANATEMRISEDQSFTGVNFVPFMNNRPVSLTATEGQKTLYVQLKDATGTIGPTLSSSVTLDLTPPAAPMVTLDATGVSGTGVKFTNSNVTLPVRVLAQDALSGISGMRLSGTGAANQGLLTTPTLPYQSDSVFNRAVTTDGSQTVYAQVIDHAGNASSIATDFVIVDRTLPSGAITALRGPGATADGYTNQLFVDVQVNAGAEPDGGTVQIKLANALGPELDAAAWQTALPVIPWFLGATSDGLKTISAQFRDTAGNLSAPVSTTITFDDTPPSPVTASITPEVTATPSIIVTVASSASDLSATEAITVSENPSFTAGGTVGPMALPANGQVPFTLSSSDGAHTVYVRFKDRAGNSSVATAQVTLDETAPSTPSFALTATGTRGTTKFSKNGTSLPFTLSGVDALSGVTSMRLSTSPAVGANGLLTTGTTSTWASTGVFSRPAGEGVVTVYAQLIDAAGNASVVVSDTIVVDTLLPSGTVTIARGAQASVDGFTNAGVVSLSLTAPAEPNGGGLHFKVANTNGAELTQAAFQELSPSLSWFLNTASEGLKTVYVVFRDSAGNESAPVSATITYDVTAPAPATAVINPVTSRTRNVTVTVSSAAGDLSPTTALTLSESTSFSGAGTVGPQAMPGGGTVAFTLSASGGDGSRTVYVRFRDRAGNETVVPAPVTLDQTPPTAPTFLLTPTGTRGTLKFTKNSTSLPFTISGVDTSSGVASMRVSASPTLDANGLLTTGTTSPYATSGTFTRAAGDATVTVYAQLIDVAGNAGPVTSDAIVVDTGIPSGTLTIARGAQASVDGFTNSGVVNLSLSAPTETNGGALSFKLANTNGAELTQAAFQELTPSLSWFLNTASEGLKTVYVVFRDSAGNESSPATASITYDVTAPTPATASLTPSTTRVLGVTVAVSSGAGDLSPTEGLTVSESSSFSGVGTVGPMAMPGGGTVPFTLASSGDGLRTVYVRFRDRAGNETVAPATVTVDQTPPTGTIDLTGTLADGFTTSRSVTSSTDVRVAMRINGATEYFLGAGNLSTCPGAGYTAMPPSGEVIYAVAAGAAGVREVRACFRDAAGNVFGGVTGGAWVPSASINFDAIPPGNCALSATGLHRNGTTSPVAGKTALTRIPFTMSGCNATPQDMAIVAGNVTCSTSASLPWQRYDPNFNFTLPNQDGLTQVNACVRDQALNVGTVTGTSMTLDTQPPTGALLTIASPADNGHSNTLTPLVSGSADDATTWGLALSSSGPFTTLAYSGTPSTTTFNFGTVGTRRLFAVFVDDVGNRSAPVDASIKIDTVAPPVPRFYSVDFDNRAAHLFWDGVSDPAGVLRYELWCGTTTASAKCGEVDGTQTDGWVLNLPNRRDQVFAVRAIDNATNASALSTTIAGTVGFRRIAIPFSSAYSVQPFDVATRGDDIYVTYSERDANWTSATGNLKVAVSNDRGLTWRFSPLDSAFGGERQYGHLGFTDTAVVVATAGTEADVTQSEVKLYHSTNSGTSWAQTAISGLTTSTNYSAIAGLGLVTSGQRVGVYFRNVGTDALRVAYSNTGGVSGFLGGTTYYTLPSSSVTQVQSCGANYSLLHAWKSGAALQVLTHYFFNLNSVNVGNGEGSAVQVLSGSGAGNDFSAYDIACVALPEATQSYLVYTSATGSSLYLRRKLTAASPFGGAVLLASDASLNQAPRVWAGGRNVFVLYRNTANELVLLESRDEGGTFLSANRARLERGAAAGVAAVMSGENSEDIAVAFTDATGTSLSLLVPPVPAVRSFTSPGVTTSRLSWTPVSGIDRYQVASGTSVNALNDFNYSSVVSYDVPANGANPLYYSPRAVDTRGMPGNDGIVWQSEPMNEVPVFTAASSTSVLSSSTGLVAYNQNVLLLPPHGLKAASTSDLTVYRSANAGTSWSAYTPVASTTTQARALVGYSGRANLFYRTTALGVRSRYFADIAGAAASEVVVDAAANADFLAARADNNSSRVVVAWVNAASDTIRSAFTTDGTAFTAGTAFAVPFSGADTTIQGLDVVKVDGTRVMLVWRQTNTATGVKYVYAAESVNSGSTWGTPQQIIVGTSGGEFDNYLIDASSPLAGGGNAAYSYFAHVTELQPFFFRGDNLHLSVTGTDLGTGATSFSRFVLDRDSALSNSLDAVSNGDGHYLAYTTEEPGGSQHRLKLAYCATDCHQPFSWRRTILATYPGTNAIAPSLGIAQGGNPYLYLAYQFYNGATYELRVLRGGANRLAR